MNTYQLDAMNKYFSKVYKVVFVDNPGYILAPWGYCHEKKHIIVAGIHDGKETKVKIYPAGDIKEIEIDY